MLFVGVVVDVFVVYVVGIGWVCDDDCVVYDVVGVDVE